MSGLLSAKIAGAPGALAASLTAKAARLAAAHGEARLLASSRNRIEGGSGEGSGRAARWRKARLLWPLWVPLSNKD